MIKIENDKPALYQWDLNQRIVLTDIKPGVQVHFSHENFTDGEYADKCPVLFSYEENGNVYANIPNIFLQNKGIITVYIYIQENEKAYTEHRTEILVLARPKPADYIYTETEVKRYEDFEERITELEEKAQHKYELLESITVPEEGLSRIHLTQYKLEALLMVINSPATNVKGTAQINLSYNGKYFYTGSSIQASDTSNRIFYQTQEFWKDRGIWRQEAYYQVYSSATNKQTSIHGRVFLESDYPYIDSVVINLTNVPAGAIITFYGVKL